MRKRVIAAVLSIILCLYSEVSVADAAFEYEVQYSVGGERVFDISDAVGKKISVDAQITSENSIDGVAVITALYDGEKIDNITCGIPDNQKKASYKIDVPGSTGKIKTYVLSKTRGLLGNSCSMLDGSLENKLALLETIYEKTPLLLANLYDSESGGFYATMSGKESPAMTPGLEMSSFVISILYTYLGVLNDIPEDMRLKLLNFFVSRYDSESGFYIDQQGATNDRNTARIQSGVRSAVSRLRSLSRVTTQSAELADTQLPSYFETAEKYEAWLKTLPWETNPWSAGDQMQAGQVYMDYIDQAKREDYLKKMFDYMESIQSDKTGFFGNDLLSYNALSGAFKVSLVYSRYDKNLTNADKLYNSVWRVLDSCEATAATHTRNACELLNTLATRFGYSAQIKEKMRVYSGVLIKNINKVRAPDGGFASSYGEALSSFGGVNAGYAIFESDIDATVQAFHVRKYIYSLLGYTVPKFKADADAFWDMLRNPETIPNCMDEELVLRYETDFESGIPDDMYITNDGAFVEQDPHDPNNAVLCINDESTVLSYSARMKLKTLSTFTLSFKAMFCEGTTAFSDFGVELNNNAEYVKKSRLLNLFARKKDGKIVLTTNDKLDFELVKCGQLEWNTFKIIGRWSVDKSGVRNFGVSYYVMDKSSGDFVRCAAAENDVYALQSNVRYLRIYSSTYKTGKFYIDDICYTTSY